MTIETEILKLAIEAEFKRQQGRSLSDAGMSAALAAVNRAFDDVREQRVKNVIRERDSSAALSEAPRAPRFALAVVPAQSAAADRLLASWEAVGAPTRRSERAIP